MKSLSYSLDGTNFQPYTGTLTFDWIQNPTLYAIADDNVANRSVLVYAIGKSLYLPLVIR